MAEPQPASPAQPGQPPAGQAAGLSLGLVDTPAGQRLAVQVTLLLTAAEAKEVAAGISTIAESMSATKLVVATSAITPR